MIGGYDVLLKLLLKLPEPHKPLFLTVAICIIVKNVWTEFVLEPDETSDDIFLYRDAAERDSWSKHGLTTENATKMLYVLYNDDGSQLTIVVGELKGESKIIVDEIKKQLGAKE